MSRYTVVVDEQKTDLVAYGPDSALAGAMSHFNVKTAQTVNVVSSENQRVTFIGVCSLGSGWIRYEKSE